MARFKNHFEEASAFYQLVVNILYMT